MSEQLSLPINCRHDSIFSVSDFHAKIYLWLENSEDFMRREAGSFLRLCASLRLPHPRFLSLKTLRDSYHRAIGETLRPSCEQLPTLGFMSANGNCLILNGFYPKIESGFTLSDILEDRVSPEFFLSEQKLESLFMCRHEMNARRTLHPYSILPCLVAQGDVLRVAISLDT